MRKIILHLCADIGSDSQPYRDAGYDVRCIGEEIGVENYTPPIGVYGVIANPVCTEFSVAVGFDKENDCKKGLFLVNHCLRIIKQANPVFWVLENPASGKLKNFIGKPAMTYEPWQFGSPWTKKTALWGVFNQPKPIYTDWGDVPKNKKLYIRPGRPKPGFAFLHKSAVHNIMEFKKFIPKIKTDADFRSLCSQGFAKAFFSVNT